MTGEKKFSNWVYNISELTFAVDYIFATIKHNIVSKSIKHRLFCKNISPECIIQVIINSEHVD